MKFIRELKARLHAFNEEMKLARVMYAPNGFRSASGISSLKEVVYIPVGLLITGVLLPIGISSLVTANTSGWNSSVVTIVQTLIPVLAGIAIALYFFKDVVL